MDIAIEIQDLRVSYGKTPTLNGLSFSVQKGEIFGFLGPNGAGKSTTIKALLGLLLPDGGQIRLHGAAPSDKTVRSRVGFLPEEASYYRFLSAVETLTFYGEIFGIPRIVLSGRIESLLKLVGLWEVRRRPVGSFSKGMMQKLSLAQALVNDPETLVLDEPTSGLDPLARMDLRNILNDLKARGRTVFFSSHELSEVELLCDSIAIVKAGRLVRSGPLDKVLGSREQNLERYFLNAIRGN